jgi:hypothetical protein
LEFEKTRGPFSFCLGSFSSTKISITLQRVKVCYDGFFWRSQWQFFLGESNIVALYTNLFEKLGKSEKKN